MKGADEAKPMEPLRYRAVSPGMTITRMCAGHGRPVSDQSGGRLVKRGGMRLWYCRACMEGKS